MAKKVVIAGACRTAVGKMGGVLSTVPAVDLGAIVIKEALNRAGVPADQVDEVLMGCVIQAGLGQNVARQASVKAGVPIEVPAETHEQRMRIRTEVCKPWQLRHDSWQEMRMLLWLAVWRTCPWHRMR